MNVRASPGPIKIMMIDRDTLGREGFRLLILNRPQFTVVGQADNGAESLALVKQTKPDIILLDLDLGAEWGLEVLPKLLLASSRSRVIVLTHIRDTEQHRKAMVLGAMGVVLRESGSEILFKAIEKVHAGEVWYDRSKMGGVLREIVQNAGGRSSDPIAAKIETLTPREREVIGFVSLGLKNKEIGERLFISETTVRHHLTSVFEKLEVSNRLELIIFAFSQGLESLPTKPVYREPDGRSVTNLLGLRSM